MPTGYTEAVQSGEVTEFRDFALRCARAMGALIMMRDDPMDAPIPDEFKPSDWNRKQLDKARFRLADVQCWSDSAAELAASKAYADALKHYTESLSKAGTGAEFKAKEIAAAERDIAYHEQHYAEPRSATPGSGR